jgi:hypothetical protein
MGLMLLMLFGLMFEEVGVTRSAPPRVSGCPESDTMISHRSHRQGHRSFAVLGLALLVALLLPALSAAAQEVSDSSGAVPAEQSVSLSVAGFDSSIGELAQVDLIVSANLESRVSSLTSAVGYTADVIVTSEQLARQPRTSAASGPVTTRQSSSPLM